MSTGPRRTAPDAARPGPARLPEVLETLEPLDDVFARPEEPLLREALYECMP